MQHASRAYWDTFTPEQRLAEMNRREAEEKECRLFAPEIDATV
jgi:hypothetical protein